MWEETLAWWKMKMGTAVSGKKKIRVLAATIIHWAAKQAWLWATHSLPVVRHLSTADLCGYWTMTERHTHTFVLLFEVYWFYAVTPNLLWTQIEICSPAVAPETFTPGLDRVICFTGTGPALILLHQSCFFLLPVVWNVSNIYEMFGAEWFDQPLVGRITTYKLPPITFLLISSSCHRCWDAGVRSLFWCSSSLSNKAADPCFEVTLLIINAWHVILLLRHQKSLNRTVALDDMLFH